MTQRLRYRSTKSAQLCSNTLLRLAWPHDLILCLAGGKAWWRTIHLQALMPYWSSLSFLGTKNNSSVCEICINRGQRKSVKYKEEEENLLYWIKDSQTNNKSAPSSLKGYSYLRNVWHIHRISTPLGPIPGSIMAVPEQRSGCDYRVKLCSAVSITPIKVNGTCRNGVAQRAWWFL